MRTDLLPVGQPSPSRANPRRAQNERQDRIRRRSLQPSSSNGYLRQTSITGQGKTWILNLAVVHSFHSQTILTVLIPFALPPPPPDPGGMEMENSRWKKNRNAIGVQFQSLSFQSSASTDSMATAIFLLALSLAFPSASLSAVSFSPKDNILIVCGANSLVNLPDGRIFKSDTGSGGHLQAKDSVQLLTDSGDNLPSPLCRTARIFQSDATYSFQLTGAGWHWLRLHFYPINNSKYELKTAVFSVTTDDAVLLHRFSIDTNQTTGHIVKEYLLNVTKPQINLMFVPVSNSFAFINAVEVVSAPDYLISNSGSSLFPVQAYEGLNQFNYQPDEPRYRLGQRYTQRGGGPQDEQLGQQPGRGVRGGREEGQHDEQEHGGRGRIRNDVRGLRRPRSHGHEVAQAAAGLAEE
ncbi:hypothetical protein SAY87_001837 [Trapa incisa]|uniref:Malectin-like domain-containing protein n=1 Tax=Trapa incisa TaxID=236973 RepID=A0AAN7JT76_9MYRT|nr:hypothetical protein SAY87_001837 [Trapa incisa]